jgi:hypothetical protein
MRRKIKNSWNSVFFQFHLSKMPDVIAFKKVFTANTSISSGMKIFSFGCNDPLSFGNFITWKSINIVS